MPRSAHRGGSCGRAKAAPIIARALAPKSAVLPCLLGERLMRIVCDNCSAKYQINDDKVRNKVFKIRCKRCAHVIVVRGGEPDAAEASAESSGQDESTRVTGYDPQASVEAPPADAIWHVVINREQVGPLTRAQVQDAFEAGEVNGDSFIWSEGMADWMRLAAVPEFSSLLPAPEPEPAPAPAAAPAAAAVAAAPAASAFGALDDDDDHGHDMPAASQGASLFASVDEGRDDDDLMMSNNAPGAAVGGASSESLFGEQEDDFHNPRVQQSSLRGQRNENSVLFSLDSLADEADVGPQVRSTGGSEGSGLIDISALAGPSAPSASEDAFGASPAFAPAAPAAVGAGAMPALVTKRKSSTGKIAAMVMGGLLLVGGAVGLTLFLVKNEKGEQPVAPQPAAGQPAAPATVNVGGAAAPGRRQALRRATRPRATRPRATRPRGDEAKGAVAEGDEAKDDEAKGDEAKDDEAKDDEAKDDEAKGGDKPARRAAKRRTRRSPSPARAARNPEDEPPPARAGASPPRADPPPALARAGPIGQEGHRRGGRSARRARRPQGRRRQARRGAHAGGARRGSAAAREPLASADPAGGEEQRRLDPVVQGRQHQRHGDGGHGHRQQRARQLGRRDDVEVQGDAGGALRRRQGARLPLPAVPRRRHAHQHALRALIPRTG
ncbi:MAG: zinc-ribbon domain-containing protein [Myxococcales bacterium]|nr:zinc-ribbon domain-containing protein [Myxococcales bacterium]